MHDSNLNTDLEVNAKARVSETEPDYEVKGSVEAKQLEAAFNYFDLLFQAHGTSSVAGAFYFHLMDNSGFDRSEAAAVLEDVMRLCRKHKKEYQVSAYINDNDQTVIVLTAIKALEAEVFNPSEIYPEEVTSAFLDSLFNATEIEACGGKPEVFTSGKGVMVQAGFHPERLESHRAQVLEWLTLMPIAFRRSSGGGYTFLSMCYDQYNRQWTGAHRVMDQLVALGNGLGLCSTLTIEDFVRMSLGDAAEVVDIQGMIQEQGLALPGGMPYVLIEL